MSDPQSPSLSSSRSQGDDLRARVMAAVRAEPVAARQVGVRRRAGLVTVALVFWAATVSFLIGRPGLRGRPLGYVVALTLVWILVAAAATWAGVARGRSMLGRGVAWKMVAATLTPVALLAASIACGNLWRQSATDGLWGSAYLACLVGTAAFALGPLAVFMATRRASDPVVPRVTGAAIAAAAGAWGALGIELHCRYTSPLHVLIGHALPVALLALVGTIVGARLLAIRSENG
jgi:hypothetical protein